ncbi:hypothetical protein [Streptomyces sp. NPDC005423]|uniref:hypothetical protein n=1 Tax=Streptomyces sp. NPDC005423 TaxID=3155343 RepID=UPI0033AE28CC
MAKELVYVTIFASLVSMITMLIVGAFIQLRFHRPIDNYAKKVLKATARATKRHVTELPDDAQDLQRKREKLELIRGSGTHLVDLSKSFKENDPAMRCYIASGMFLAIGATTALLAATIV